MRARVTIMLKTGVLDPQGKAIEGSLKSLGFEGVDNVRQGKIIELDVNAPDQNAARQKVVDMCDRLLANTVIESYRIDLT